MSASVWTLMNRALYNNRKGRSARRRLVRVGTYWLGNPDVPGERLALEFREVKR